MLGLLSHRSSSEWTRDLSEQVADYGALKREILPDIFSVAADPLSHMVALDESRGTHSDEWNKYFEVREIYSALISLLTIILSMSDKRGPQTYHGGSG